MVTGARHGARRRTLSRLLALVVLLAAQAGCAAATTGSSGSTAALTAELRQNRDQYAGHAAIIRVTNPGNTDVIATRVTLSGSAFDGGTERDRTSTIPAGQTRDLTIELPRAACDATTLQADVSLILDSGATSEFDDLADPTAVLQRVHAADCVEARVAAIATVSVEPAVRLEGAGPTTVAILSVTVIPTGGAGTLELIRLRATVLLRPAPSDGESAGEDWPIGIDVDASSTSRTLEFRIVPTRCDPHALAEDKVGTLFPLVVSIDDGSEETLTLSVLPETSAALKDAVRARCA